MKLLYAMAQAGVVILGAIGLLGIIGGIPAFLHWYFDSVVAGVVGMILIYFFIITAAIYILKP